MYERIVVGVSKAESAKEAARHAIELAAKLGAQLHVVTAFDGSDARRGGEEREHAEGFVESIALAAPTTASIRTHALPGDPAAAILEMAEVIDADLIVVGNKGMKGAGRILGSVPGTVVRRAPCSVLIVSTT